MKLNDHTIVLQSPISRFYTKTVYKRHVLLVQNISIEVNFKNETTDLRQNLVDYKYPNCSCRWKRSGSIVNTKKKKKNVSPSLACGLRNTKAFPISVSKSKAFVLTFTPTSFVHKITWKEICRKSNLLHNFFLLGRKKLKKKFRMHQKHKYTTYKI